MGTKVNWRFWDKTGESAEKKEKGRVLHPNTWAGRTHNKILDIYIYRNNWIQLKTRRGIPVGS